jgi:hypothetical protein
MAGDQPSAEATAVRVQEALKRVYVSALPHLTKHAQAMDVAPDAPSSPLNLQDLEALRGLLQRQSIDALEKFEALQAQIRPLLEAAEFKQLQNYMQELQFAKAADLLVPLLA